MIKNLVALNQFINKEALSGILLFVATVAAVIVANSTIGQDYYDLWHLPLGINIGEFVTRFNDATKEMMGDVIPVVISVYEDRSFDFVLNGHNQNTMTLDGDLLQAVNNGIIKSIKKLSTAGLIKGDNQTQEALNQLAKIQVKQIENEIKIQSQIK